jgi:hypothetical protein
MVVTLTLLKLCPGQWFPVSFDGLGLLFGGGHVARVPPEWICTPERARWKILVSWQADENRMFAQIRVEGKPVQTLVCGFRDGVLASSDWLTAQ